MSVVINQSLKMALAGAQKTQRLFWTDLGLERGDRLVLETRNHIYVLVVDNPVTRSVCMTSNNTDVADRVMVTYQGARPMNGGLSIMVGAFTIKHPCELSKIMERDQPIDPEKDGPLTLSPLVSLKICLRGSEDCFQLLPVV
jgi:hypothetical protein